MSVNGIHKRLQQHIAQTHSPYIVSAQALDLNYVTAQILDLIYVTAHLLGLHYINK